MNQHCVSDSVSNKVSRAALNSPATHGVRPEEGPAASSSSRSCSSAAPSSRSIGIRLIVPLRRVDGARIGLTGCCAETMVSSFLGCAWVAMALAEKRPLTKGLIEPVPSAPSAAPRLEPRRSETKSGLRESRFRSRKPSEEYVTGPLKWLTVKVGKPDRSIAPTLKDEWLPQRLPKASTIDWSVFLCDRRAWSSMMWMRPPGLFCKSRTHSALSKYGTEGTR